MNVIESDNYRTARQAIAADPIMRRMAIQFWSDAVAGKVDANKRYDFEMMKRVADEYYRRGGKVDGYGMGDHQKAFIAVFDEIDAVIKDVVG